MDPHFRVEVIRKTEFPQQTIYAAMHQDYTEAFVTDERDRWPGEAKAGELLVKSLLNGDRGHYGPLEHPQITLNCGYFPHSTMQQLRTHRVGVSFDVSSFRYTSKSVIDAALHKRSIGQTVYLRPVGEYRDRQGKCYQYNFAQRDDDKRYAAIACDRYRQRIEQGFSEEHARGLIPFDVRQHWVMSANVRSLMHVLDLRWKADAQLECQQLCELIWPHFEAWVPAIADWYLKNRAKKARLAP